MDTFRFCCRGDAGKMKVGRAGLQMNIQKDYRENYNCKCHIKSPKRKGSLQVILTQLIHS